MEFDGYLRFVLALLFVLGLIGLIGYLLRRYGFGTAGLITHRMGQERRIAVIEIAAIDARRRLVLVRRDSREHLILLGATTETLIESSPVEYEQDGETSC